MPCRAATLVGRPPEARRRPRTPLSPPEEIRYGRSRSCRRGRSPHRLARRAPPAPRGEDPRRHLRARYRPRPDRRGRPRAPRPPSTPRPGPTSCCRSTRARAPTSPSPARCSATRSPRRSPTSTSSSSDATRSSVPTCRSPWSVRRLEVHHGDGLVEQQMFTLPIRALPGRHPHRRSRPTSAS